MNWEIFGIMAGLITSSGFIPQIIKGYKTKKIRRFILFLEWINRFWYVHVVDIRNSN